uniref:Putative secreted protein n=1 Tax=Amblyomma cajennense TaxID=34607 RepID=A0A023FCT5_AMBCJ
MDMEVTKILPIAFGFLSLGVSLPAAAAPKFESTMPPLCPGLATTKVQERAMGIYEQCPCKQEGDAEAIGKPCAVRDPGYDGEWTVKLGECEKAVCRVRNIPLGCSGVINVTRSAGTKTRIGCAYTCNNKTTQQQEFNYVSVGTPCKRALPNGKFEEKTCQKSGDKILCRDEVDTAPSC